MHSDSRPQAIGSETSAASDYPQQIRSAYADDPFYQELIEYFVGSVPDKQQKLAGPLQAEDWVQLYENAHQLKGAAGGYGFPSISDLAEEVCSEITLLADVLNLNEIGNRSAASASPVLTSKQHVEQIEHLVQRLCEDLSLLTV